MRKTAGTMFRDREFLMHFADPITVIAVSTAVAAGTAVASGVQNYVASQKAADAARSLKNEQASALKAQRAARDAEAAQQATAGATFGRTSAFASVSDALGFGTGSSGNTGFGRGQLTGGS